MLSYDFFIFISIIFLIKLRKYDFLVLRNSFLKFVCAQDELNITILLYRIYLC
jgi:hypothetical protein